MHGGNSKRGMSGSAASSVDGSGSNADQGPRQGPNLGGSLPHPAAPAPTSEEPEEQVFKGYSKILTSKTANAKPMLAFA